MKILCPQCKKLQEVEHVERGRRVECSCSCRFILDELTVMEDYSQVDEPPPESIGPCKIERFIGHGGMGKVYKAFMPSLQMTVAVKTLLKEFAETQSFKDRFIKSAKICAKVNHPNIVRIYDCGEEDGLTYLILEYIDGGSAQEMLDRDGPLTEPKILDISIAVSRGLVEAERLGIVHRDIKPENIMYTRDGEYKLSDLGLARRNSEDRDLDPTLTMEFVSLGTPQYMPPEQAIDARSCDIRADIYSIGASIYQLATGRLPFQASDSIELRKLHASVPPEPPSNFSQGISKKLEKVILKCLQKRRDDRYQSATELLDEFLAIREGRELPSHIREAEERCLELSMKNRRLMPALIASLILLSIAIAVFQPWRILDRSPNNSMTPIESSLPAVGKPISSIPSFVPSIPEDPGITETERRHRELWNYANSFAQKCIEDNASFDTAIANFQAFADDHENKETADKALEMIQALNDARKSAVSSAMSSIAEKARGLLGDSDFAQAAALYEGYSGILAKETETERLAIASAYWDAAKKRAAELKRISASMERRKEELLEKISAAILKDDIASALNEYQSSRDAKKILPETFPLLEALKAAPLAFAGSFRSQIGQDVYVNLKNGSATLSIKKVEGNTVIADERLARGVIERKFDINSASISEKASRLASFNAQAKAVILGIEAMKIGNLQVADSWFKQAGDISSHLLSHVENIRVAAIDAEARRELLSILACCGFKAKTLPEPDTFPDLAAWFALPKQTAETTKSRLIKFMDTYSGSSVTKTYSSAIQKTVERISSSQNPAESLPPLPDSPTPIVKDADDLILLISRFNPQCKDTPKIELRKEYGYIIDMHGLNIASLEALRGLPLRQLDISSTDVEDLSPLKGSPLEKLIMAKTLVSDYSHLEGMPLKCIAISPESLTDRSISILKAIKTIETIGTPQPRSKNIRFIPAREFWSSTDTQKGIFTQ